MLEPSPSAYVLSNDEFIIRQYRCAEVRPAFRPASDAFLDVTNKRVIYSSDREGRSPRSKLLGELPLHDVSGINISLSQSFNLGQFILLAVIAYLLNAMLADLVPFLFESLVFGILFTLPYLIMLLFERQLLNPEIKERLKDQVAQSEVGAWLQEKRTLPWEGIARVLFMLGLSIIVWTLAQSRAFAGVGTILRVPILLLGYLLIYILAFPRSKAFRLTIGSRSGGSSGISIRSALIKGVGDALDSSSQGKLLPGKDAESLARELGALILDMQQMGNLGAQKWRSY